MVKGLSISHPMYITGASGVLGFEFLDHFSQSERFEVTAVTRSDLPRRCQGTYDHKKCASIFDAEWFDPAHEQAVILHCAGLSNPRAEFPGLSDLYAQETAPHIHMYERLLSRGWRGRMIFMSSGGAVYGEPQELPIRETHPLNPKSPYGFYKSILERGFGYLAHHFGSEVVNLRVANPYGSTVLKIGQGVIPILIEACRNRTDFTIIGDGSSMRDYIHIADLNEAILKVIELDMVTSELTLNIGSGRGVTLNGLIDAISDKMDSKPNLIYRDVDTDVQSNVLSIEVAQKMLGWSPEVTLTDGLSRMIEAADADRS